LLDRLARDLADRNRIADHRIRQGDQRPDPIEVDLAPLRITRIGIRILRFEGRGVALADIGDQPVIRLEGRKFGAELGAHRRQCPPRIDAEASERGAAELDILIGVMAPGAGEVQEQILGRYAGTQLPAEIITNGLADPKPGLPGRHRGEEVRRPDAAGRAVEGAGGASMRVAAHQHGSRQGIGPVGNDCVADALLWTDIVKTLDAKAPYKISAVIVRLGRPFVGRRDHVIVDDGDLVRVVHPQDVPPFRGKKAHIDHHGGIDIDDDDIARPYTRLAAVPGEDVFNDGHSRHARSSRSWAASHRIARLQRQAASSPAIVS
jgi:hypothetical protein